MTARCRSETTRITCDFLHRPFQVIRMISAMDMLSTQNSRPELALRITTIAALAAAEIISINFDREFPPTEVAEIIDTNKGTNDEEANRIFALTRSSNHSHACRRTKPPNAQTEFQLPIFKPLAANPCSARRAMVPLYSATTWSITLRLFRGFGNTAQV